MSNVLPYSKKAQEIVVAQHSPRPPNAAKSKFA